ncbi:MULTISPECIES: flavodoxin [Anaerococcus]|uniref:Flavodoxin n=1 Tax=Anaerococcus nagyae TaxID=1755241 RepID=A0A3E2THJ5_9FIRM|nr:MULTISPECIES: flavodoxin [Anaerococcus]MBP2069933.1 flavodoxin short chain [Anaerococcus nagyae]MDU1827975.1 flavodoxin [Anaerococcus sp.]MDU1863833.1 flavodoxin [Anaerococcus sp.]MDU2354105.1 flavodoxin [Anaerococcus sp.]MDU2566237.1 flavodoxin [Anaerococcus sp.]
MSKVAVIYWSGTGNTENMANAIFSRLKEKNVEADLFEVRGFDISTLADYDGFAFGCPAMGSEELEEAEFEPMFESVENKLDNKPVVIFGSYEWNDGQWMLDWQERCKNDDINLAADGLAAYGNPEDDDIKACYNLADSLSSKL